MPSLRTVNNRSRQRKRKAIRRWLNTVVKVLMIDMNSLSLPWFRLNYKDIEAQILCDEVHTKEMRDRFANLMIYGTTHPEIKE